MTCIIGLVEDGKVYMGADSMGIDSTGNYQIRKDPKVFKNRDFLIAFTYSFRMGQLLRYSFYPPLRHPDKDVMEYMCTDFIEAVRECFEEGGFKLDDDTGGPLFLVGYEGRVFEIQDDFQVCEVQDDVFCAGAGGPYAAGALHILNGYSDLEPPMKIYMALEAASANNACVSPPFVILDDEGNEYETEESPTNDSSV